jgi:uncharacterized coiled-coil protein SlyX
MRNVTVKELDECLTQLNTILAGLTARLDAVEKKLEAKPTPRKTATKGAAK